MAEALSFAKRPPVISHTGARALTDHPRNTSDDTIRAVARKGGVVGVYFMPFLTLDSQPKAADLIAHIEHVAKVAGEDHVGIGTDNGVLPQATDAEATRKLNEWASAAYQCRDRRAGRRDSTSGRWSATTTASIGTGGLAGDLQKRGWSETRLEKLMGGNFLRVYREAWGG